MSDISLEQTQTSQTELDNDTVILTPHETVVEQNEEAILPGPSKQISGLELESLLLRMVTNLGLQASDNAMFKGSVFGRDSLISLEFLRESGDYPWLSGLSDIVLTTLSRMRGITTNARIEEQPGKFAHELRVRAMPGMNLDLYDNYLAPQFNEYTPGAVLIYTTVDTTPLAIMSTERHVASHGTDILRKQVGHIDPSVPAKPLGEIIRDGVEWMVRTIEASQLGLLEYARANPDGHEFHVLEDGKTAYQHEDGTPPNISAPIAYLTSQGQAHEALLAAAKLFPEDRDAEKWLRLARHIQTKTLELFWMPELETFAAALDRDPNTGAMRQVKMLSTVQPSILDSTLFDSLDSSERAKYVHGVLRNLFSDEFLTEAGVRSVALRHDAHSVREHAGAHYQFWDYQGTRSVWPVLTHRAARGCRRQGYLALAADLDARVLNAVGTCGNMRELFYVSPQGRVVYDPEGEHNEGDATVIYAPEHGQATQTWTIAAVLAARYWLREPAVANDFERELLQREPTTLWASDEFAAAFNRRLQVAIDLTLGRKIEKGSVSLK